MKKLCLLISVIYVSVSFMGCSREPKTQIPIDEMNIVNVSIENNEEIDLTNWEPSEYETVNNFDDVTMIVKKGSESSTKLTVTFENNTNSECIYGDYFCLEKKINDLWYQVPVTIAGDYGFNSIGYNLAAGDMGEMLVDWNWLYGSLETGEYRIVKDILDFRGTGDYDTYYLGATFTIY
ncbi:MAG: hypothetical protein CVV02_15070 [Firmicutes bacterium HGW-Firmicutes-7]|nr:MAG: hypothetical protein CVV02_15070 [Firmicutes bacterium HGW-Firmicutes-7]